MRSSKKLTITLWTLQGFLGLFFILASGAPKLLLPLESIPMPIPLSSEFLHFIGVCEVLGGLGLVLPGITRIQTRLTPLAGLSLVLLTICAAVYQLMGNQPANAGFALGIGAMCAFVAYGRSRLAPLSDRQPVQALHASAS